jgi:NADPH:quinone reductase-like Zn-dependent oxidoreductase
MATMKAVRIHSYGGPEVLAYEGVPRPEPADGEVLVRVKAAGVNPVDWKIRDGSMKGWLQLRLPAVLGCDLAGVVEAVGTGVSGFRPGDEVFAYTPMTRDGAYADFAVVKQDELAHKPKTVGFNEAAALPVATLTAWGALFDRGGLRAGQRALVHAAAGGVGSAGVQLAKAKGAWVAGTASARNLGFVRELGADQPIDYTAGPFEDAVKDVDVVFDTIGGDTQRRSLGVLKPGGILVSIVEPPSAEEAAARGVRAEFFGVSPDGRRLAEVARLVDGGKLKAHVETVLPLKEVRKAHELSQTGRTRGKIVLVPAGA